MLHKIKYILIFLVILLFPVFLFLFFQYASRAAPTPANIVIDTQKIIGQFPDRWKTLAQGGEELGTRMLENVVPQVAGLYPRYIRLDHIYDGYDVVKRNSNGQLSFDFTKLDETVCDIYHTGAKPFFSLGYMPLELSSDDTVIGVPKNWADWELLVQKTVEHYSGKSTRLCGQVGGPWMTDIYYEVWNEPDLESFGKWSLYGGQKDYKKLYQSSVEGAQKAKNVHRFLIGGPATTALYQNWVVQFLDFVQEQNLRLDFISWHHYSKNANDYIDDVQKLNAWLADPTYISYRTRPRIISEWGFDSNPNEIADTTVGAAHTLTSIRNFIDENITAAFLFEIKDGPSPSWGILTNKGVPKPRYHALQLLNGLQGYRLSLTGEGSHVTGLASLDDTTVRVILTNYDLEEKHSERVPVRFTNLKPIPYLLTTKYLDGSGNSTTQVTPVNGTISKQIIMPANSIVSMELKPQ